jgi:hypothetical protein
MAKYTHMVQPLRMSSIHLPPRINMSVQHVCD